MVRRIQDNLKAMKSHQESYVNKRCRPLEFKVGDHMYLRVSPMKGVKRYGMKGKLSPLHWTLSHPWEMWNRGIQAWFTTLTSRGSWHIPHVITEEVFDGTRGCGISWSDITRDGLDLPRASNQSLGSKGSCHKVQKSSIKCNGVIILKQKQCGKSRTSSVRAIRISCYHSEGTCDCSLFLFKPFSFKNSGQDFFLGGGLWHP
jgi:hypothetical protein